jgi:predicted GNAT family acetyltransferase
MADHPIHRNETAHRFEAAFGKKIAKIDYAQSNGLLNLLHTEVPKERQGQGIGSDLARAALEYARAEKLDVIPTCPFVSSYIRRHPEYLDIVAPSYRQRIQQG